MIPLPLAQEETVAMRTCRAANFGRYVLTIVSGSMLILLIAGLEAPLYAKDTLDITRDEEKTVYSIGSSDEKRREEAKDKEKAWDMLKNMGVIVDKRQGQTAPPAAPAK
jgi:hypothetical protein